MAEREGMTLRRIVLVAYRDGGHVGVLPVRLYGPTPIDTAGYIGHFTHEQMQRMESGQAPVDQVSGLREALTFLNACREAWPTGGAEEYWQATNALIVEIARREGRSIGEVAVEIRAVPRGPVDTGCTLSAWRGRPDAQ